MPDHSVRKVLANRNQFLERCILILLCFNASVLNGSLWPSEEEMDLSYAHIKVHLSWGSQCSLEATLCRSDPHMTKEQMIWILSVYLHIVSAFIVWQMFAVFSSLFYLIHFSNNHLFGSFYWPSSFRSLDYPYVTNRHRCLWYLVSWP